MKTFIKDSKAAKLHHKQSYAIPTHDAIAKRAYEIYLKSGCKKGLSEQNWYQAERELYNEMAQLGVPVK